MKKEALKLADEMESENCEMGVIKNIVPAMIRRLVEELDKQKETIKQLNKTLGFINSGYEVINLEPQTKPLSDEEIIDIADTYDWHKDCAIEFARAILRKAQEK